jgi:hypothetical protein
MSKPAYILSERKRWQLLQIMLRSALDAIEACFVRMQITYMPIKGAYLHYAGFARQIETRKMADIDLLFQKKDYQRVINQLSKNECFTLVHNNPLHFHATLAFKHKKQSISVEIHRAFNDPLKYRLESARLFERAAKKEGVMALPCVEDALLMAILHALSHIAFYFNQSVLDEIRVLSSDHAFCWERFWRYARKTGATAWIVFVLRLYQKITGERIPGLGRSFRGEALARWYSAEKYDRMSQMKRRLFMEAPFVRNPLGMYAHRALKRRFRDRGKSPGYFRNASPLV